MDHLEQIVKALGVLLGTLVPLLKPFFGHVVGRTKHLDERYTRLKSFFDDGATARHPMLVEASFASAVGHAKLNSQEIELLLRQQRPTQFMELFLRSRDYICSNAAGDRFELQGLAKHERLRKTLGVLGAVIYAVLVGPAFWVMMFVVLPKALGLHWTIILGDIALCALMLFIGFFVLIASSKLGLAAKLVREQVAPNTEPASAPVAEVLPIEVEAAPAPAVLSLESTDAAPVVDSTRSLATT